MLQPKIQDLRFSLGKYMVSVDWLNNKSTNSNNFRHYGTSSSWKNALLSFFSLPLISIFLFYKKIHLNCSTFMPSHMFKFGDCHSATFNYLIIYFLILGDTTINEVYVMQENPWEQNERAESSEWYLTCVDRFTALTQAFSNTKERKNYPP